MLKILFALTVGSSLNAWATLSTNISSPSSSATRPSDQGSCPVGYELFVGDSATLQNKITTCKSANNGTPSVLDFPAGGIATDAIAKKCFKCTCLISNVAGTNESCMSLGLAYQQGVKGYLSTLSNTGCPTQTQMNSINFDQSVWPKSCFSGAATAETSKSKISTNSSSPSTTKVKTNTAQSSKNSQASTPSNSKTQKATTAQSSPTGDVSLDEQTCRDQMTRAQQCCSNPMSCLDDAVAAGNISQSDATLAQQYASGGTVNSQQSIQQACTQMQQASTVAQNVNRGLGAYCYSAQSACESTCNAFKQAYNNTTFDSMISTCQGLSTNVAALGSASLQGSSSSVTAAQCAQMAQAQPSSATPTDTASALPLGASSAAAATPALPTQLGDVDCKTDPNLVGCNYSQPVAAQEVNAAGAGGVNPSAFNVAEDPAAPQAPQFPDSQKPSLNGQLQNQAAVVPNGQGGGLPGGSDGPSGYGLASNSAGAQHIGGNSKVNTNVLEGFQGGGYSGGSSSGGNAFSGTGFGTFSEFRGRAPAADDGLSKYQGLDLKAYLPGGRLDPKRRAQFLYNHQIGPAGANIFEMIHTRYEITCRMGRLKDCPKHN